MAYGYFGTMRTTPGDRDKVVEILVEAADSLRGAGCSVYSVSVSPDDPDLIWVYEVWDSKESHDASLQLPETRAAIGRAMPMLTGEFTSRETTVVGGLP
jgi:quinol monooxygenase YgiN